jgi:hypothetical protein
MNHFTNYMQPVTRDVPDMPKMGWDHINRFFNKWASGDGEKQMKTVINFLLAMLATRSADITLWLNNIITIDGVENHGWGYSLNEPQLCSLLEIPVNLLHMLLRRDGFEYGLCSTRHTFVGHSWITWIHVARDIPTPPVAIPPPRPPEPPSVTKGKMPEKGSTLRSKG